MEFRRNSHSDERRRRVLIEETGLPLSSSLPTSQDTHHGRERISAEPVRSYPEAALAPRQPRVVDLIPRRRWTVLLLTLLVVSVAAGLEALHGYLALGHTTLHIAQVPAVDLAAPGNLADWFSSSLLLAAAGLGILTYLIRRHRVDDYRGRYRMWYWMVPLLVVASMDQVCDLQRSLRTALLILAGLSDYASATWIWSCVVTALTAAVVVRLAIEMRACRLAVASLGVALACFAVRQVAALNWVLETPGVVRDMTVAGLVLSASIHLFLALCLYSRYVYRDACGEIAPRARVAQPRVRMRRARGASSTVQPASSPSPSPSPPKESAKAVSSPESKIRVDAPHTAPAAGAAEAGKKEVQPHATTAAARTTPPQRGPLAAVAQHAAAADSDADDDAAGSGLSKAERRRLRKLQRREKHPS